MYRLRPFYPFPLLSHPMSPLPKSPLSAAAEGAASNQFNSGGGFEPIQFSRTSRRPRTATPRRSRSSRSSRRTSRSSRRTHRSRRTSRSSRRTHRSRRASRRARRTSRSKSFHGHGRGHGREGGRDKKTRPSRGVPLRPPSGNTRRWVGPKRVARGGGQEAQGRKTPPANTKWNAPSRVRDLRYRRLLARTSLSTLQGENKASGEECAYGNRGAGHHKKQEKGSGALRRQHKH